MFLLGSTLACALTRAVLALEFDGLYLCCRGHLLLWCPSCPQVKHCILCMADTSIGSSCVSAVKLVVARNPSKLPTFPASIRKHSIATATECSMILLNCSVSVGTASITFCLMSDEYMPFIIWFLRYIKDSGVGFGTAPWKAASFLAKYEVTGSFIDCWICSNDNLARVKDIPYTRQKCVH